MSNNPDRIFFDALMELGQAVVRAYPHFRNGEGRQVAQFLLQLLVPRNTNIFTAGGGKDNRISVCVNGRDFTTDVWVECDLCGTRLLIIEVSSKYYTSSIDIDKLFTQLIGQLPRMKLETDMYGLLIRSEQMKLVCLHRHQKNAQIYDYEDVSWVKSCDEEKQVQLIAKLAAVVQCPCQVHLTFDLKHEDVSLI